MAIRLLSTLVLLLLAGFIAYDVFDLKIGAWAIALSVTGLASTRLFFWAPGIDLDGDG